MRDHSTTDRAKGSGILSKITRARYEQALEAERAGLLAALSEAIDALEVASRLMPGQRDFRAALHAARAARHGTQP
jgi:hypothetical protein